MHGALGTEYCRCIECSPTCSTNHVAMDEGTSCSGQTTIIEEYFGHSGIYRNYPEKCGHFNAAHGNRKSCIDIVSDACIYMNKLLWTWRENDWHDEGMFLRLNKKKCEDLLSYLVQAKESYHSNTCEYAAREFLTTVKRAEFLMEESSHNKWLLKAVELWKCSQHFIEVLMDLFRLAHIMSLGVDNTYNQINYWLEQQEKQPDFGHTEQLLKAQSDDKEKLDAMVKVTLLDNALKKDGAEHQLALLLDDRLKDQTSWHPPIFREFNFCIRSRFRLSKGSSKSGQNGVVLRFPWVYKKQFAVKMRYPNTNTMENMFKHEFDMLDKYRSPYIVGVVGYWELQSKFDLKPWTTLCPFLLMEAMECDLEGLICKYRKLRKGQAVGFSALETLKLMLPVAKALRFLHDKDVAHRDIKPQNIMCSKAIVNLHDALVKLIDFGVATEDASKIPLYTHRPTGTYGYMDPEMRKLDPETGMRVGYDLLRADVFSFAMVFVELLTWRSPWKEIGVQRGRDVQHKLDGNERPPLPQDLPDYISFIVECCWCADPTARPTYTDICSTLQSAELLLLDGKFDGERNDLFFYEDGDCIERSIADRAFLQR